MSDATGRAVLQVAATAAGYYFGGPFGAAIGSYLGAQAGYAIFPLDPVEGPRLSDLRATQSTYGAALPIAFGSVRVAGTVIWWSGLREVQVQQQSGGKGGPEVTTNTYEYFADVALALCEGPIVGVGRIWADQDLVYNVGAGAGISDLWANPEFADGVTLYLGTETQLADPTMEAALGVGNVPGYRGTAYIVIRNMRLTGTGGRVQNLMFEVVTDGSVSGVRRVVDTTGVVTYSYSNIPRITSIDGVVRVINTTGTIAHLYSLAGTYLGLEQRNEQDSEWLPNSGPTSNHWLVMRTFDGRRIYALTWVVSTFTSSDLVCSVGGMFVTLMPALGLTPTQRIIAACGCADGRHMMIVLGDSSIHPSNATAFMVVRYNGGGPPLTVVRTGTTSGIGAELFAGNASNSNFAVSAAMLETDLRHYWVAYPGGGPLAVRRIDDDGVLRNAFTIALPELGLVAPPTVWADRSVCWLVGQDRVFGFTRTDAYTSAAVPLATVVQRLCERVGLDSTLRNTAGLTGTVDGYAIGRRMTARAALDALRTVYAFDAVESGGQVRFFTRGGAPVATVSYADLLDSAQRGAVQSQWAAEEELPNRVDLQYLSAPADYQEAVQTARRAFGGNVDPLTVSVPVVLADGAAQAIAKRLLFEAAVARVPRRFALPRKWSLIEAGDVVTLALESGETRRVRVLRDNRNRGTVQVEAIDDDVDVYTQAGAGQTVATGQTTVNALTPTLLRLLDLPPLRDADDTLHWYVAASGLDANWPGAVLYRSTERSGPYDQAGSVFTTSTLGAAEGVLGNYLGGNTVDELNRVDVTLTTGTLASVTLLEMLNGANAAVLGNEIIQFRTATLVSGTRYTLSGLLRGRLGTEDGMTTHADGERFVLLNPAATGKIVQDTDQLNVLRYWKPVTAGRRLQDTLEQSATLTGRSLRPLAPVFVAAGRTGTASNVLIRWTRRGRISASWLDQVDVPLGESAERYDVEILNPSGSAVVRTFSGLTVPEVAYSSAQMTADLGGVPATLNVRVYQLSGRVGRGVPAVASVQVLAPRLSFRYWRVWVTAINGGSRLSIDELRYRDFAGNILTTPSSPVVVSSAFGGRPGSRAFDGDNLTDWSSASASMPQNIQVDMGTPQEVVTLGIDVPAGGFEINAPRDFLVEGSNDATNWTTVLTVVNSTGWGPGEERTFTVQ